jgi:hypothetical protein
VVDIMGQRIGHVGWYATPCLALLLVLLPERAWAQSEPARTAASEPDPRGQILTGHVGRYVSRKNWEEGWGYGTAVLGAAGIGVGAAVWDDDRRLAVTYVAGFGATTAAVTTSLFLSRDTRIEVLGRAMMFDAAVAGLAAAVARDAGALRWTFGGLSAGYFGVATLQTINSFSRLTPTSTMRRHRDRLENGEMSDTELPGVERDFEGTRTVIPPGVVALPMVAGSLVGLVPAFDEAASTEERNWSIAFSAMGLATGLLIAIGSDEVNRYHDSLDDSGFSFAIGPAGVQSQYTF